MFDYDFDVRVRGALRYSRRKLPVIFNGCVEPYRVELSGDCVRFIESTHKEDTPIIDKDLMLMAIRGKNIYLETLDKKVYPAEIAYGCVFSRDECRKGGHGKVNQK